MLVHRVTERDFRQTRKGDKDRQDKLDATEQIYKSPEIDHVETYSQRSPGQRGLASLENLFIVSYAYSEFYRVDKWQAQMEKSGYQIHAEHCFYGRRDHTNDAIMIIVAEANVNLAAAVTFIHQNPHPSQYVYFDT